MSHVRIWCIVFVSLCLGLALWAPGAAGQQILIDHQCTDPAQVSDSWISQVKANLHIAYQHTSHGSQLITGMDAIESFPAFGSRYEWTDDGSAGLDLDDYAIACSDPYYGDTWVGDLSTGDYINSDGVTGWVTCTREFFAESANPHVNVIMWSWCSINGHDAQRYVDNMEILVSEFPNKHFVFMTGHAEGEGEYSVEGSVHYNNELIRAHCAANNRILFDFADIEAYDPDGTYFWDQNMWDNLDYDGGNWAVEWIAANPGHELSQLTTGDGVAGYDGCYGCAHSDSPQEANLNCVLKGRASWWLFARLAGWTGPDSSLIFSDGFETGTTSAWDVAVP